MMMMMMMTMMMVIMMMMTTMMTIMVTGCFMSLSTLIRSYLDDDNERLIMKGSVQ